MFLRIQLQEKLPMKERKFIFQRRIHCSRHRRC